MKLSKKRNKSNKKIKKIIKLIESFIIFVIILALGYFIQKAVYLQENIDIMRIFNRTNYANLVDVPEYNGELCVQINNNKPYFTEEDYKLGAFEKYSELDELGRCGVAYANICNEIMPKDGQIRESISKVKPTGWQQTKINEEYVYNRCHLIAYQLADENANEKNLITGTRYFNTQGMLPFENKVAEYIKQNKNNHVLYRVTPHFRNNNLLVSGVEIEAYSIEDKGNGICFNVYIYNIQPGVNIDYETGKAV